MRIGFEDALALPDVTLAKDNVELVGTRDFDFADIRNYSPGEYAGILALELPEDAVAKSVLRVIEFFVANKELLELLPGRLAIVQPTRVRLRPPVG